MLQDGLPLIGIQTSLPLQDFIPQTFLCHLDRRHHFLDLAINMPVVRLPVYGHRLDGRLPGVALVAVDIGYDVLEFGRDFEWVRVEVDEFVDIDLFPASALVGHKRLNRVNLEPGRCDDEDWCPRERHRIVPIGINHRIILTMEDTDISPRPALVNNDSPSHLDSIGYRGNDNEHSSRCLCRQFRYDRGFSRTTGWRHEKEALLPGWHGGGSGQVIHPNHSRHRVH